MTVEWERTDPPVGREAITAVEEQWGIRFPEDFVTCAMTNHGGRPRPNGIVFYGESEPTAVFNTLLNFSGPHPWKLSAPDSITEEYDVLRQQGLLADGVFPFAYDPAGNYLAFDYRDSPESPVVVFLEHEITDDEGHFPASLVAHSFTELLNNLRPFEDEG